jgi:hypothetical protein
MRWRERFAPAGGAAETRSIGPRRDFAAVAI